MTQKESTEGSLLVGTFGGGGVRVVYATGSSALRVLWLIARRCLPVLTKRHMADLVNAM